jgi:hypothetical protein
LYIVYLLSAADLGRRFRLSLGQMIALVAAGFVPFLAFVVERLTTRRIEQAHQGLLVRSDPPAPGGHQEATR